MMPIVDVSDTSMAASGTTKRISINNILACSPSATLASATITGDLTVDTNTLKVDSTNNRVGIRTVSPAEPLTVDNTTGVTTGAIRIYATDQAHSRLSIQNTNGQAFHLIAGNPGASNAGFALYDNTGAATRWYVDSTGVHSWQNVGGVASTAMTLNATGLGVGVVPAAKLHMSDNTGSPAFRLNGAATANNGPFIEFYKNNVRKMLMGNESLLIGGGSTSDNFGFYNEGAFDFKWYINGTTPKMTLDASGNLILLSSNTPATLTTNGQLTVNATSNTNLRFSYRGSDGTTRVANITLA
jgi:hypothetical protein